MSKPTINIVYAHLNKQNPIRYETSQVRIILSKSKKPNVPNVGMNAYSIINPTKNDSILLLEPRCVLEKNFNINYLKKFKYVFSYSNKPFKDKLNNVVVINYPSWDPLISKKIFNNKWLPWNERSDEIIFLANNKHFSHPTQLYDYRVELADTLYKMGLNVSWYGNIPFKNKPWFKGSGANKHNILTKARFTVCTENSYDKIFTHNYLTEKYPHAILAGTVPIYIGCHNIDQLNVPKSYIDLRPHIQFVNKKFIIKDAYELILKIKNYNKTQYDQFCKEVHSSVNINNGIYHLSSFNRVYEQMIKFLL